MSKKNNTLLVKKVTDTILSALPHNKHFPVLCEMFDFASITNFKQTIHELIDIDQMHIFGISAEMQTILKHLKELNMLGHISNIRQHLQEKYQELHNKTVVLIKVSEKNRTSLHDIIASIKAKIGKECEFVYIPSNIAGITIQFNDQIIQYTPSQIAKQMKAV
jgi:F0F1-type ATP synthase delta subunit